MTALEQIELEQLAREYLGETVELTYEGFRPIVAYGAGDASYHVFYYDREGEAGTYIGASNALAIPRNGEEPYFLFREGE